jgi:hypothetical protein
MEYPDYVTDWELVPTSDINRKSQTKENYRYLILNLDYVSSFILPVTKELRVSLQLFYPR